jgi:signal peptidase II
VTLVAIGFLLRVSARLGNDDRWLATAIGAILGGATGNLVDRVRYGEVIDFIDVYWGAYHWPAFNVADASISLAVTAIVLHSLGPWRRSARSSPDPHRGAEPRAGSGGARATGAGGPRESA